jgi:hypothetical protein
MAATEDPLLVELQIFEANRAHLLSHIAVCALEVRVLDNLPFLL